MRGLRSDFGPIYGLVNNAGLGLGGVLGNMRDSDIERLVSLNTLSPDPPYQVRHALYDDGARGTDH